MVKKIVTLVVIVSIILVSTVHVLAETNTTLSVESVEVVKNEQIVVPIEIRNNHGICGATFSISYDENLVLKEISRGVALENLSFTKPGDIKANPFNIIFDGTDEDSSNGIILYLTFEAMTSAGEYGISVSYEEGNIVNGALDPVEVKISNGGVIVKDSTSAGDDEDNDDNEEETVNKMCIQVSSVATEAGEIISVPVYLSGNTGVCGITLGISYHKDLVLKDIIKGDSLPNMIMTKPGNLSANPSSVVFDSIDEDKSNGLFFTLQFLAPETKGSYDVTVFYEEGDIVNGALNPVVAKVEKGWVIVGAKSIEVTIDGKAMQIPPVEEVDGNAFLVFYNSKNMIESVRKFNLMSTEDIKLTTFQEKYVKFFCWDENNKPLCNVQKMILR